MCGEAYRMPENHHWLYSVSFEFTVPNAAKHLSCRMNFFITYYEVSEDFVKYNEKAPSIGCTRMLFYT
jgi:hypothetical protein